MISLVQALNFKVLSMKSGEILGSSRSSPAIKHISIQGTAAIITIEPFPKTRTKIKIDKTIRNIDWIANFLVSNSN
jgi:hypothetical protein